MEWLTNWIMREGPGIPKNAPKKKGLALFFSIIRREAWELFKLNLIMLLLAIPIITIPASFAAACRIAILMIEDENVFLWRDFQRAFRKHFFRATYMGVLLGVNFVICAYAVFIYGQMTKFSLLYVVPTAIAVFATVLILMVAVCLFVLMPKRDLSNTQFLKAAFLAAVAKPLPVFAGIAFAAALWFMHIIFYPASIFLPVVLNFSLGTLAMTFGAFGATEFALGLVKKANDRNPGVQNPASSKMHYRLEETT